MEEFLRWVPLLLIVAIIAVVVIYNRRHGPDPATSLNRPVGIGGWLIFPAIWVIIMPLGAAANALSLIVYFPTQDVTELVVTIVEIAANIVFAIAAFILGTRFFQYKRETPNLYLALSLIAVAYTIIDYIVVSNVFEPDPLASDASLTGPAIGIQGGSLLWAIYMKTSVRVRNTFTR